MTLRIIFVLAAAAALVGCGPSGPDELACHHFRRSMDAAEAGDGVAADAEINRAQQHAESSRLTGWLDGVEEARRDGDVARGDLEDLAAYCPDGTGDGAHADADADVHPHVIADP